MKNVHAAKLVELRYKINPKKKPGKNPHAVAMGKLGGKIGGESRIQKLSPEKRREIAILAATARWDKMRGGPKRDYQTKPQPQN